LDGLCRLFFGGIHGAVSLIESLIVQLPFQKAPCGERAYSPLGFFRRSPTIDPVKAERQPSPWQWVYAVALASTVVWASGHGQVAAPDVVNFDKIAHFLVFGLMATLTLRSFRRAHMVWAVLVVSMFGAIDELHQSFTPGRSMDYHDWLADTLGAILAAVLYHFWPWYRGLLETPVFKPRLRPRNVAAPAVVIAVL
jgi:VanZ family protein